MGVFNATDFAFVRSFVCIRSIPCYVVLSHAILCYVIFTHSFFSSILYVSLSFHLQFNLMALFWIYKKIVLPCTFLYVFVCDLVECSFPVAISKCYRSNMCLKCANACTCTFKSSARYIGYFPFENHKCMDSLWKCAI